MLRYTHVIVRVHNVHIHVQQTMQTDINMRRQLDHKMHRKEERKTCSIIMDRAKYY